ncbi:MAG: nitroreductase family protein, partial [Candidatus Aenigmatarchaeota archaeon]
DMLEIIKKRRSIRTYKGKPLSKEIIDSLLEAAKHAPSARNLQQLEYKVITNKALIRKMSDRIIAIAKKENPNIALRALPDPIFYNAPLLVVITGSADNEWINYDAAIAAENMMLYATSIDLGTCFIGRSVHINKDKELLDELRVADGKKVVAAVVCGYADEEPQEREKKMSAEFFK